ncbi:hypothetical protein WN55_04528 [Dufourea novaeangliae]|uniref:Uncharacterized protein n=1 Tax=Dufourea novaeangliae TaxID=178035 RepID=A0A154P2X9_DUFNO|nr:hypothetical protein WN55_04528 [Dufourea novaeangliae]
MPITSCLIEQTGDIPNTLKIFAISHRYVAMRERIDKGRMTDGIGSLGDCGLCARDRRDLQDVSELKLRHH